MLDRGHYGYENAVFLVLVKVSPQIRPLRFRLGCLLVSYRPFAYSHFYAPRGSTAPHFVAKSRIPLLISVRSMVWPSPPGGRAGLGRLTAARKVSKTRPRRYHCRAFGFSWM